MNKNFLVVVGIFFLITIVGVAIVFGFTYSISGQFTDALSRGAVAGMKVRVVNHEGVSNTQGNYSLSGIKLFEKKELYIEAPIEYEKVSPIAINYSSRTIVKNIVLKPTIEQTVKIFDNVHVKRDFNKIWDLTHPDDQAYWGNKETYLDLFGEYASLQARLGMIIQSKKVNGTIKMLSEWKHPISNKAYYNVYEVPAQMVVFFNGQQKVENFSEFYQDIDGFYHVFSNTDKESVMAANEDLRQYVEVMKL